MLTLNNAKNPFYLTLISGSLLSLDSYSFFIRNIKLCSAFLLNKKKSFINIGKVIQSYGKEISKLKIKVTSENFIKFLDSNAVWLDKENKINF